MPFSVDLSLADERERLLILPGLDGNGSAFNDGWYGHLQKDLRTVLGLPVEQPVRAREPAAPDRLLEPDARVLVRDLNGDLIFVLFPLDVVPRKPLEGDPHRLRAEAEASAPIVLVVASSTTTSTAAASSSAAAIEPSIPWAAHCACT